MFLGLGSGLPVRMRCGCLRRSEAELYNSTPDWEMDRDTEVLRSVLEETGSQFGTGRYVRGDARRNAPYSGLGLRWPGATTRAVKRRLACARSPGMRFFAMIVIWTAGVQPKAGW